MTEERLKELAAKLEEKFFSSFDDEAKTWRDLALVSAEYMETEQEAVGGQFARTLELGKRLLLAVKSQQAALQANIDLQAENARLRAALKGEA